jgi:hypothetical protein
MTPIAPIPPQRTRNSLRIYNVPVTGCVSDSLNRKCALSHCIQRFQGGGGTPTVRSLCQTPGAQGSPPFCWADLGSRPSPNVITFICYPVLISRTSVPSQCRHKIKVRGVSEGAKVTVPREEGNASVNTSLGD